MDALVNQEWDQPWEIVLSDNNSSDRSVEIFNEYAKKNPHIAMRVVDASQIQGQPHALNEGVRQARGRSVAFCDSDDVVAPGWLSAMGNALEEYDFVAARMDLETLNSEGVPHYRSNAQETTLPTIAYPPYLHHAGGGTIGVRKEVFENIGEFDHTLPILHDTDFCFRAQLAGFQMHYVPESVIRIRLRGDPESIYRQARNYGEYNVKLSKRYRKFGKPQPNRWKRFLRSWYRILRSWHHKRADIDEQARFTWRYGWEMGRLIGALKYRVPPP